ncbi:MAG: hypothetical protein IJA52_07100 [Clostridia bacterium]|nr:hypothetical protein [Clostridia bacterium]
MKRFFAVLLTLAMVFSIASVCIPAVTVMAADGDEIRSPKKIISVVYDDSGSMNGDGGVSWVYASYAMQAMTALLNEQDELYVTFMSEPEKTQQLSLSDIDGSVKLIREWNKDGGTPYTSVTTAKSKLDAIKEKDKNTQFWLVVFTDGGFDSTSAEQLQSNIDSYKGEKMSNGSLLNVVYMAIGSTAVPLSEDKSGGLYTYKAATSGEITECMKDIANLVSGRLVADNVKQVDSKTISFSSKLPLYSISVLVQDTSTKVTKAECSESKLRINRNIHLEAYNTIIPSALNLFGNAAVIDCEDSSGNRGVITPDNYVITFAEDIDISNVIVQYEPAIGVKMVISKNGIEIDKISDIMNGDKITVEMIPVVPGTDDKIKESDLPKGAQWKIEYVVDDKTADSGTGKKLSDVEIKPGENVIRGIFQIPGFSPSLFEKHFTVEEIVYELGLKKDQPSPLSYYRNEFRDGSLEGGEIKLYITGDGNALTKDEQKRAGLKLEVESIKCDNSAVKGFLERLGRSKMNCELVLNDDGSWSLKPQKAVFTPAFMIMAGDYEVTVRINQDTSITETGTFTMVPRLTDWIDLLTIILVLLAIAWIIRIITKKKFHNQVVYYGECRVSADSYTPPVKIRSSARSIMLTPFMGGLLNPFSSCCKYTLRGITLCAGDNNTIIADGKSIAKSTRFYKMGRNAEDPQKMHSTRERKGEQRKKDIPDEIFTEKNILSFAKAENASTIDYLTLNHNF